MTSLWLSSHIELYELNIVRECISPSENKQIVCAKTAALYNKPIHYDIRNFKVLNNCVTKDKNCDVGQEVDNNSVTIGSKYMNEVIMVVMIIVLCIG